VFTYEAGELLTDEMVEAFPGGPYDKHDVAVGAAIVRGYCNWHIAPSVTCDLTLDHAGGPVLFLPSLHLTAVTEVRSGRTDELIGDWRMSASGMLSRECGWPRGFGAVKVTVEHGITECPADLAAVVVDIARRRSRRATRDPELLRKTVGPVTHQYVDPKDAVDELAAYRHVLDRFTL
jgi:hypothetical protein